MLGEGIRDEGAWEEWLAFFLDGIAQVATEATVTATRILELRERDRERIGAALKRRAAIALALLDELYKHPVATARAVEHALGVSQPTSSALVRDLTNLGILRELTGKKRNRVFAYRDYLNLFPGVSSRQ